MDTATIEKLRGELTEAHDRAGALLVQLSDEIEQAYRADVPVTRIARLAGMSRPKVYGILRKRGVAVDSDRGRELVARRWQGDRDADAVVEQPSAGLGSYLEQRAAELGEHPASSDGDPDLFALPVDGPASEPISVLEAIERFREEARARGLRD